jgi:hypothetical protein
MSNLLSDAQIVNAMAKFYVEVDWPEDSFASVGQEISISVLPSKNDVASWITESFVIQCTDNLEQELAEALRRAITKLVAKYS